MGVKFSRLQCYGKRCNWTSKLKLPQLGYFRVFCCITPRFVHFISTWTDSCKSNSLLMASNGFDKLVWDASFFGLKLCLFFSHMFAKNNWCNFTSHIRVLSKVTFSKVTIFRHCCITCKSGIFHLRSDVCKKATQAVFCLYIQFTFKNWRIYYICAAWTWRRLCVTTRNKLRKLLLASPTGRNVTNLHFGSSVLLALAGIFDCSCEYFNKQFRSFSSAIPEFFTWSRGCFGLQFLVTFSAMADVFGF